MKTLSTKTHGAIDYATAPLLMAAPMLLDMKSGPESAAPMVAGAAALAYSAMTDYEYGLTPAISMRAHLAMDAVSGVLLAASPWLFGFAHRTWVPHVALGLFEIAAALSTERQSESRSNWITATA
jgi:hypothetical protein